VIKFSYSCFRKPCPKWKPATQKIIKFEKSSTAQIDLQIRLSLVLSSYSVPE
jgi:hypothetical protein